MSESGIFRTVLFPTLVHPEDSDSFESFTREMSGLYAILSGGVDAFAARKESNRKLSERVNRYPEHFIGFGVCPSGMSDGETGDWIERDICGRGLSGIGEITFPRGSADTIEPIFRSSRDSGKKLPLWIHTFHPADENDVKRILSLAVSYPDVPVIMGHAGGYHWIDLLKEAAELRNVYIDMSASFTIYQIRYAAEIVPERVLFSSDAPYGDPVAGIVGVERAVRDLSVRRNIFGGNFERMIS
jgi:predicted TIM-barrel fold metal-dependent hydrolase